MHHVVFLDACTLIAQLRSPRFAHTWRQYDRTAANDVENRLAGATIAITNKVRLGDAQLANLPDIRMIAVAATGVDGVDLAACQARGIVVSNIRHYAAIAVPEHVFMLILTLRRQLLSYRADLAAGRWQAASGFCLLDHPIHDLRGSTLGVVGYGDLGRAVAELGRAFGMRVLVAERPQANEIRPGRTPFDELLAQSDVVTLHCPLTPDTRHLLGRAQLARLRRGALVINTARGALVDPHALLDALASGTLGGAGIDVLDQEPPREGHPLLDVQLPNLIVTPHIAWASRQAMQILADQLIDNIEAFAEGTPRNVVYPAIG